ncbi:MAG: CBU_0592 family membrane protein [Polyangiales bacterium]
MPSQIASIVGAVLVLSGYLALQRGWLGREHRSFHALNFFGSALLTAVAVIDRRAGFILLEGAWALLSLPGLLRPRASDGAAG